MSPRANTEILITTKEPDDVFCDLALQIGLSASDSKHSHCPVEKLHIPRPEQPLGQKSSGQIIVSFGQIILTNEPLVAVVGMS